MINVGFIYRKENPYLTGNRPNNNFGKFYLQSLGRNMDINIRYFPCNGELDCSILPKMDVWLLFDTIEWGMPILRNASKLKGLKIASANDAHSRNQMSKVYGKTRGEMMDALGIEYCYYQHDPEYFYKYYPKSIKYWWVPIGFDADLYKNVTPFQSRTEKKVLLTGVLGGDLYRFRDKCKGYGAVKYVKPGGYEKMNYTPSKNDGDNYKKLLEQYKFAIASGYSVVNKYFEIPAAGCVVVAHVGSNGAGIIGFDESNAVMVSEDLVDKSLKVIGETMNDPCWESVAARGRQFVFDNYTHDKCVERLIGHIKEVL